MTSTMRTVHLGDDTPPATPPNTGNSATTDSSPSTAPPRTPALTKLEGQIRDFYSQLGTYSAMMMPDPFAGSIVAGNAELLASAWTDLAAQDPNVRRTIEKLLSGGSWAAVIIGHAAGVVAPILAYYNKLPQGGADIVLQVALAQASLPVDQGGNPIVAHCIQQKFGVRE